MALPRKRLLLRDRRVLRSSSVLKSFYTALGFGDAAGGYRTTMTARAIARAVFWLRPKAALSAFLPISVHLLFLFPLWP